MNAVYLQTNDAERNEVVAFRREADGTLNALGSYATEGRGTGKPHLPSQSSIVVNGDRLLVVNAGSDEITLFAIGADGLSLLDRVGSGGSMPTSIAVRGTSVFVLNAGGEPNVTGFSLGDTELEPTADTRALPGADPAQIGFTPDGSSLIVSDRANDALLELPVAGGEPTRHSSSGATPYGFDFTPDGTLVVTEAFGGTVGAAATSSVRPRDCNRSARVSRTREARSAGRR